MTSILGISAFYHDSAATLVIDGKIISAAQEERFSRKKHDASYPYNAVKFVLENSNLKLIFKKPGLATSILLNSEKFFNRCSLKILAKSIGDFWFNLERTMATLVEIS